jgi:hypothetical protein
MAKHHLCRHIAGAGARFGAELPSALAPYELRAILLV